MATKISPPLDAAQCWWLLAAATVACLPLAPHLPGWLAAAVFGTLALRAWQTWMRRPPPSRGFLVFIVVAATVAIFLQYRTLFGQNPGVALLAALLALKQLESGVRRDGMGSVLLCYFLALTTFFYSQSIPDAAALLAVVAVTTAALAALTDSRQHPLALLRLAGLMLAQATPFLLILFVLFPRVSGPLWGLPRDAYSALTGLSDSMAPGSIGKLSQSDAIAFRARFKDPPPPREELYWRGPVLTRFDGLTWRPAYFGLYPKLPYTADERRIAYEVTLEPHNKPWLFALEFPATLPADSFFASDYQMLANAPVVQRRRYEMQSRPARSLGIDEWTRVLQQATALPGGANPRTVELGRAWRTKHAGDEAILNEALAFFLNQRLIYTLEPPLLGEHTVDEFLFDTRQGFCEHFAGAFVFAMRAAGVPARVVTGYQGGEINPVDGFMTVRQSDAHAWAEVWLPKRGWTRVDPTAASHPQRVAQNLAAAVPASDPLPILMRLDQKWLRDWRYRWDAVTNTWNQWVLGYNPQRQRDFLARLGIAAPDANRMTAILVALCSAVLAALTLWALRQRRRLDPAQALWLRAAARLARCGLPRRPWEGPQDYAQRVAAARPELSAAIREIADLYAALRYGRFDPTLLPRLRQCIASFKP